jgi:hypothetical protein
MHTAAANAADDIPANAGGGREVAKLRGEQYQLFWRRGADFVRLAAATDALVVPFGAVGADDAFDLHMDTQEVLADPLLGPASRALVARVLGPDAAPDEAIFPITRLPGSLVPSPLPVSNLGRVYFQFAPPLDTRSVSRRDRAACAALGADTKAAVEAAILDLLAFRARDPERDAFVRAQRSAASMWQLASQPL